MRARHDIRMFVSQVRIRYIISLVLRLVIVGGAMSVIVDEVKPLLRSNRESEVHFQNTILDACVQGNIFYFGF